MPVPDSDYSPSVNPHPGLGFGAFVCMMAGLMALNGLAIDAILPALPQIAFEYDLADDNRRQLVVSVYLIGFGALQILFGPLSDRFGRRGPLLIGIATYAVFGIGGLLANSFEALLVTRFLQGAGAAATRTLTIAIVRDNYAGRRMARVTSMVFIVFLAAPVLAPSIGQLILLAGSWHWIFALLTLFSLVLLLWVHRSLPESLHRQYRLPLSMARIGGALREVISIRQSIGYTLGMTLMLGCLFGFLNQAQQLFSEVFGIPSLFTLVFAAIAGCMALASLLNARIVERLGMRRVSHTALLCFISFAGLNLVTALVGMQNLVSFSVLFAASMFCFGLTTPNFGAMAMEPVGHIAGTASSVQGCITTLGGALLGFAVGQLFDGSAVPLLSAYVLFSATALLVIVITEGGLFQPREGPPNREVPRREDAAS